MALTGTFNHHIQSESETTETISVVYPADLPADDPNYDRRGTTVEETIPLMATNVQAYENSYVIIKDLNVTNVFDESTTPWTKMHAGRLIVNVYASEDDRNNDSLNPLVSDTVRISFELDCTNHYERAYQLLKQSTGYESLIDA